MPIVSFQPSGKRIEAQSGETIYSAALRAGLPVASSCSADFVCGRCNMIIVEGAENLSPQSEMELRLLKRDKNPLTDRISCQTKVLGDCTVTTRYW